MHSRITESVKESICAQAARVGSSTEIANVIFNGLVDAGIDWQDVDLEEMKPLLVEAMCAFRRGRPRECLKLAS